MSLIIIEGVDRTGKTTLAETLISHLQLDETHHTQLLHFGPPKENALSEYLGPLLDYDPRKDHIVCDRFHIGEDVWPHFFDRDPRMTTSERGLIELFLHARGGVVVHATRDILGLREAFRNSDPPEPLPEERVFEALNKFKEEIDKSACLVVDFSLDKLEQKVGEILKTAQLASMIAYRECTETEGLHG